MNTAWRWVGVDDSSPGHRSEPDRRELRNESRKAATRSLMLRQQSEAIRERSLELCRRAQPVIERSLLLRQAMQASNGHRPEGEITGEVLSPEAGGNTDQ